jgi:uncharacterized OB-fold protein
VPEPPGTAEELLRTRLCRECGAARLQEVVFCPRCQSPLDDLRTPGRVATLVSYTTIFRAPVEDVEWPLPFSIGLIETDLGSRAIALLTWEPSDADIDRPVELDMHTRADGQLVVTAGRAAAEVTTTPARAPSP